MHLLQYLSDSFNIQFPLLLIHYYFCHVCFYKQSYIFHITMQAKNSAKCSQGNPTTLASFDNFVHLYTVTAHFDSITLSVRVLCAYYEIFSEHCHYKILSSLLYFK